uniref:2-phosphoxylose phosphatase 1 n=1 Tax=Echinostoma caproni TaxID=27848 RepID=A0A183AU48_9TREM
LSVLQQVEMDSERSLQFEREHAKMFELLGNKTGKRVDRNNVWEYFDVVTCMRAHNYSLPDWYTDALYREMSEVARFYWVQRFASTSAIVRLEIGVFLKVLRDHLLTIVNGSKTLLQRTFQVSIQHLMAYSAHDTDVCYLLAAFGVYDQQSIPYSAAVVIELLGPEPPAPRSEYRLRLVYKKGYLDNEGTYLQFGACTEQPADRGCPLDDVLNYLAPLLLDPDQFFSECQVEQRPYVPDPLKFLRSPTPFSCVSSQRTTYTVYVAVACILLFLLCLVGVTVGLCIKRTSTTEILRREIGVFLHSFVQHMNAIVHASVDGTPEINRTNFSTSPTMAYSAHDTTVTSLLSGLGLYDNQTIEYSAAVVLELLSPDKVTSASDHVLRVLYKRSWHDETGTYLQFPSCPGRPAADGCPLTRVLEQIRPLLVPPDQFTQICSVESANSSHVGFTLRYSPFRTFALISFTLCATFVVVSLVVFLIRKCRRQKRMLQDDEQVVFVRFDHQS